MKRITPSENKSEAFGGDNSTLELVVVALKWQCQEFCVIRIVDLTPFFQRKIFRVT